MTRWVLLRGWARDSRHWGSFVQELEAAHRAHVEIRALDLPGNGALAAQRSPGSVAAMVEAYRGELAAGAGRGPIHVLGLSLGSMVALAWAHTYPGELASLVLASGSSRGIGRPWERLLPGALPSLARIAWPGTTLQAREAAVLSLCSSHPRPNPRAVEWARHAQEASTSRANALRQLIAAARFHPPRERPQVPILVLAGARDRLVSPNCSIRLAIRWQLPLQIHPEAGHDVALDAPEWLARRCAQWGEGLSQNRREIDTDGS